jgi:hypothetical protein
LLVARNKSLALFFLTVAIASVGSLAGTQVGASPAPAYIVVPIKGLPTNQPSSCDAINSRGDVVGELDSAGRQVPFLYRNGHTVLLRPLAGTFDATATDINGSDVISVDARRKDGTSEAFAVRPSGATFVWIPLKTVGPNASNLSVVRVAQNGDMDGTVTITTHGGSAAYRSVIWKATPKRGYSRAKLLPMSTGFDISVTGGIWSRNGSTYVAGAQGNGREQGASLWSPAAELTFLTDELPFVSTIGGAHGRIYGAGTTYSGDVANAWLARLSFGRANRASLTAPAILPNLPGFSQEYGEAVTVDVKGDPIVVGDAASDGPALDVRGVEWKKGTVQFLNSMIGASAWSITGAEGINTDGEIAGQGIAGGVARAVLLRPAG